MRCNPDWHYDTSEKFTERMEHDLRKKRICEERGIRLCIIPYTVDCHNPEGLERFIRCWRRMTLSFMNAPMVFPKEHNEIQLITHPIDETILNVTS